MNNPADTLAALAPCPFCGGTDIRTGWDDFGWFQVFCGGCSATVEDDVPEKSIAAWNRRASLKGEAEPVAWIGTAARRDLASKGHAVVYAQTNPAADDNERPLIYGDTTPPAPQAVGEVLVDRIAYALAAHEVWGGQITPDEALKDEKMRDECYSRAELVAEMIATNPTPSPAPQGGGEACDACGGCGYTNRPSGSHSCWKCAPTPPQPEAGGGEAPGTSDWMAEVLRGAASHIEVRGQKQYVEHLRAIASYVERATPPAHQPGEVGEAVSPLLAYSVEFMNGWMQDEADEARRNWQRVRDAALAPKEKGNG